jgi:hypothetical protein
MKGVFRESTADVMYVLGLFARIRNRQRAAHRTFYLIMRGAEIEILQDFHVECICVPSSLRKLELCCRGSMGCFKPHGLGYMWEYLARAWMWCLKPRLRSAVRLREELQFFKDSVSTVYVACLFSGVWSSCRRNGTEGVFQRSSKHPPCALFFLPKPYQVVGMECSKSRFLSCYVKCKYIPKPKQRALHAVCPASSFIKTHWASICVLALLSQSPAWVRIRCQIEQGITLCALSFLRRLEICGGVGMVCSEARDGTSYVQSESSMYIALKYACCVFFPKCREVAECAVPNTTSAFLCAKSSFFPESQVRGRMN